MIHIGVDMHKNFSNFAALDETTDALIEQRLDNDEQAIRSFLAQLPGRKQVTVEANRNWYWFVDLLQDMGVPVELSNPFQTKAIAWARVKTDTVDARMLAYLLKANLLPTCWIPDQQHRNLREFVRFRTKLVRLRTQVKNHLRALLSKHNLHPPLQSLWGPKGRKYLQRLSLGYPQDQILIQSLEIIDLLDHQIHTWNETIRQQIKHTTELKLLCSAPGIGPILAITILLETGPITRFPSAKKYAGYAGLVPKVHSSAGKTHYGGHLSRQANRKPPPTPPKATPNGPDSTVEWPAERERASLRWPWPERCPRWSIICSKETSITKPISLGATWAGELLVFLVPKPWGRCQD